jgi:beta-phosphoglucomutase
MQTLFGVIFDMDGVLVDSAAAHLRTWQQLGTEIGTPFSEELFQRTFGQRNASIIPQWLGQVPPPRLAELDARKEWLYRQLVREGGVRVFRRIPELLIDLWQLGARLAVASSGPRENVELLIDVIGAGSVIDASVASEDVREGKPHPEAFLTAAQRLGVVPAYCAVVEDSVHGIQAAKRAGMLAVAVVTSTAREQLAAAGADLVANEAGDLQAHRLALLVRPPT